MTISNPARPVLPVFGSSHALQQRMILHRWRRVAVDDLPDLVALVQVDGRDAIPWRLHNRQPLHRWSNAAGADHRKIRLTRLRFHHAVDGRIGSRGRGHIQVTGFGIERAAFPVGAAGTWKRQRAFRSLRCIRRSTEA